MSVGIEVLLFDKHWNKDFSHKNIIRVSGGMREINKIKIKTMKITSIL